MNKGKQKMYPGHTIGVHLLRACLKMVEIKF